VTISCTFLRFRAHWTTLCDQFADVHEIPGTLNRPMWPVCWRSRHSGHIEPPYVTSSMTFTRFRAHWTVLCDQFDDVHEIPGTLDRPMWPVGWRSRHFGHIEPSYVTGSMTFTRFRAHWTTLCDQFDDVHEIPGTLDFELLYVTIRLTSAWFPGTLIQFQGKRIYTIIIKSTDWTHA